MIRALALLVAVLFAAPLQAQVTITPASAVTGGGVVTGPILLPNNVAIRGYTAAGVCCYDLLKFNTSDLVEVGATGANIVLTAFATVEQRNGTNAQAQRIYNTYTDGSNYERANVGWTGNDFDINTEEAGTGIMRNLRVYAGATGVLRLGSNGGLNWQINGGHLLAETDATYDIGAVGASRPRNIYISGTATAGGSLVTSGNVTAGAGTYFSWLNRSEMFSPSSGIIQMLNAAENGFSRLILGTNDASGVALGKSGTQLYASNGNDSAYTDFIANRFMLQGGGSSAVRWLASTGSPEGVVDAPIGSLYSRTDGGAGTSLYIKQSGSGNTGWAAVTP